MSDEANGLRQKERQSTLWPSPRAGAERKPGWDGPTYYGRPQLKSAPFNNWIVGAYIFLAGLSGSSALLGTIADFAGRSQAKGVGRRGRLLALLAPTVGSALLIKDLHTPQRFYNMLRLFKGRSPMSIGTWILVAFSASLIPATAADFLARLPGCGWMRRVARVVQIPGAAAGAGLSTYTASLLSATSTPVWAAAPRPLAVRFGASSIASAAAALSLGESDRQTRRALQLLATGALALDAAGAAAQTSAFKAKGVEQGANGRWGRTEKILATGVGVVAPAALYALSLTLGGWRGRRAGEAASLLTLAGSALFRVSTVGMGDESALRPEVSLPFAQPENLPKMGSGAWVTGDITPATAQPGSRPKSLRVSA